MQSLWPLCVGWTYLMLGLLSLWSAEDYAAKWKHASVSPQSLMAVTQLTLKAISHRADGARARLCVVRFQPSFSPYCSFYVACEHSLLSTCVFMHWTAGFFFKATMVTLKTLFGRRESSILHSGLALNRKGFICFIIGLLALFVYVCVRACVHFCTLKQMCVGVCVLDQ